jgi:hypothetical protein
MKPSWLYAGPSYGFEGTEAEENKGDMTAGSKVRIRKTRSGSVANFSSLSGNLPQISLRTA